MILVVGATGMLGGRIAARLLAQGRQVRILVRHDSPSAAMAQQGMATPAESLIEAGAQSVYGDLRDRASLDEACQGIDTVIATANSVMRDLDIQGVDLNGTLNLIEAARAAGVRHFIYISVIGARVDATNPFLAAKAQCEQRMMTGDMTYTILKPNVFMEVWIGAVVGGALGAQQPVTLVGAGDHRHTFISIEDVADFAVAMVDNPAAYNQCILLGGPSALNWTEVVDKVGQSLGFPIGARYVGFDDPLPIPDGMVPLFRGFETFETDFDSHETAAKYGVTLTPVEVFAQRFFAPPA